MARFVIAARGAQGDVLPFLALGRGLQRRGHFVRLALPARHAALAERAGLGMAPIGPDLPAGLRSEEMRQRLADPLRGESFRMRHVIGPGIRQAHHDLMAACRHSRCEWLIGSASQPVTPMAAETLGIPWVPALMQPIAFLSAHDPPVPPGLPWLAGLVRLGRPVGVPLRAATQWTLRRWGVAYAEARRQLRLAPAIDGLLNHATPPPFGLALFSPHLAAPQPDWVGGARPTGFCRWPGGTLAPEVADFLDAGPPPLVASLGTSMAQIGGARADAIHAALIAAAGRLGLRLLLLVGAEAPLQRLPARLPPGMLAVVRAPMDQVLPRAAAVLHHGGSGTTDLALAAGRPMVVVPFTSDQVDNAARLVRRGVAEMLPARSCDAARIAAALSRLLRPETRARAARIGALVAAEDGVAAACEVIEAHVGPGQRKLPPAWRATPFTGAPSAADTGLNQAGM